MGKNKNKNRDSVSQKERQKKKEINLKNRDLTPFRCGLQDMVLRINQQLRCSCGIIYADILACCTSCGKPNPLNA